MPGIIEMLSAWAGISGLERGRLMGSRRRGAGIMLLLASLAFLNACASTDDPREGGFFNGLANLPGGYDQRIAREEQALANQRTEGSRLAARKAALEQEHAQLSRDLALIRGEITTLERGLATKRREIAQGRADIHQEREVKLVALQKRLAEVKSRAHPDISDQQDLKVYRQELSDIKSLMASLD